MKAVNEGRIGITPSVVRHWDLCIQCRACEVACPSGVPYGRLIEATMKQVENRRKQGLLPRLTSELSLKQLLPHQKRLSFLFSGIRLYQKSGLQAALQKSGALRLFAPKLAELESSLPVLPAFPPSFFPHSALEDGDVLPIDFRILEPRDESVDFSRAVVEVISDAALATVDSNAAVAPHDSRAAGNDAESQAPASSSFEVGNVDLETVAFEGWTSLWDLSDGWTLPLRVGPGDPAPFRLSVRGLLLRGKTLEFPEVEFTPARGWLVCEER